MCVCVCVWLEVAKCDPHTLAYNSTEFITIVKSFMVQSL